MEWQKNKSILEFYELTISLKEMVRSGWKQWKVPRERLESVAEHIFGTCMLAVAIASEHQYDVDISKVVLMLTLHELEEIIISDITPCDEISKEEKMQKGHEAIRKILGPLKKGEDYIALIHEFDAINTPESQFAFMCDKLEANLMAFHYDQDRECTYDAATKKLQKTRAAKELKSRGAYSMRDFFCFHEYDQGRLDKTFQSILVQAYKKN